MKNNLYFENIFNIGNLYMEHVFLDFYKEPIFFVCIDDYEQLYVCLCSEIRDEQRWVIAKSSVSILQELIDGKRDMTSAFKLNSNVYLVIRTIDGEEKSFGISTQDIDSLDLPEEGTLLRCNQMKAMNYLTNKKFQILSNAINIMLRNSYGEKEIQTYNMIIKANASLEVHEKDVSSNVLEECLPTNDSKYEIGLLDQSNGDKNDAESINDEYLFAA